MKALFQILRFLKVYTRPYRGAYALGLLCLWITNYIVVRVPELVGRALDILAQAGPNALAKSHAIAFEVFVLGAALVGIRTLSRVLFFNPGRDIEHRLTVEVFEHLLALPRAFFVRHKVGELVSLATSDTQAVRLLVGFAGLQICNIAFALPLHVYKMWQTDVPLTMWCLLPIALGTFYLQATVTRFYGHIRDIQGQTARLAERVLESFAGVATVRAHAAHEATVRRFDQRNHEFLHHQLVVSRIRSFSLPALTYAGYVAMGLVVWVGGQQVVEGTLPVGHVATFMALLATLVGVLTSLVWVIVTISRGAVSLERLQELLTQPTIDEHVGSEMRLNAPPHLEVAHLTFGFDDAPPVLHDLSFCVKPGKMLGIFGKTGAGKTVLLQLLARIYEPPLGTVIINGQDVRDLDLSSLREGIAVVPQDPFLFSASLRENVAMCDPEVPAHELPELTHVLAQACMATDLLLLPAGVETMIGERGIMLSGGQRQRTAFARALYRQPHLLLLDDVLSAVDQTTEAKMVEAIFRLRRTQGERSAPTTVVISHRTSVLEYADEIIVLDEGRIVARGHHRQLIAGNGDYAQAHHHQRSDASERVPINETSAKTLAEAAVSS